MENVKTMYNKLYLTWDLDISGFTEDSEHELDIEALKELEIK